MSVNDTDMPEWIRSPDGYVFQKADLWVTSKGRVVTGYSDGDMLWMHSQVRRGLATGFFVPWTPDDDTPGTAPHWKPNDE